MQECLDKCEVDGVRLHATGLQTFCKLVDNDINNLPMGFSYAHDSDNSPLLKLIFSNMLRVGRASFLQNGQWGKSQMLLGAKMELFEDAPCNIRILTRWAQVLKLIFPSHFLFCPPQVCIAKKWNDLEKMFRQCAQSFVLRRWCSILILSFNPEN